MKHRLLFVVVVAAIIAASHPLSADEARRDGNYWLQLNGPTKVAFVTGFFDGMTLGHDFSYWKYAHDEPNFATVTKVADSWDMYVKKFMAHVTNDQIADGLDDFYKDYRNRSILISDGVWLVLNEIAGTPKAELEQMIESWRRNAGG